MPFFIARPPVVELFQWTGDLDALHAWIDPKVDVERANGWLPEDFAIDLDPETGNLRLAEWWNYRYARPGDWVSWQTGNAANIVPAAVDGNPWGYEPVSEQWPAQIPGFLDAQAIPSDDEGQDASSS